MFTATTSDIEIQVATHFVPEYSVPFANEFLFAYHIRITNHGNAGIQVLSREWHIHDGITGRRSVVGDGLVGKQPHIAPGHTHEYVSYCNLNHPIGQMQGRFFAVRKLDGQPIALSVPAFTMVAPHLLN